MSHAPPPARLDHVGIAVDRIGHAEPVLFALGCEGVDRSPAPDGTFEWATYTLGDASRLELIAPLEPENFLTDYLDEHGSGLHHVTVEVADLDAATAALEAAGVTVVDRSEEADWTEAFCSPRNPTGALIQLMEYHDAYDDRGDPADLYVHGDRLTADSEDSE